MRVFSDFATVHTLWSDICAHFVYSFKPHVYVTSQPQINIFEIVTDIHFHYSKMLRMNVILSSRPRAMCLHQGSYSNEEIQFQYIPGWVQLNFQDISYAAYRTSVGDQYALKHLFRSFWRRI